MTQIRSSCHTGFKTSAIYCEEKLLNSQQVRKRRKIIPYFIILGTNETFSKVNIERVIEISSISLKSEFRLILVSQSTGYVWNSSTRNSTLACELVHSHGSFFISTMPEQRKSIHKYTMQRTTALRK